MPDTQPTPDSQPTSARSGGTVLLLGAGPLVDAAARALDEGGATVTRLEQPTDRDIRDALDAAVDQVVVMSRSDHLALRWALVVVHVRPTTPTLVTIFDRHVAAVLAATEADVRVVSVVDLVTPCFAGPCLDPAQLSVVPGPAPSGVRAVDGHAVAAPLARPSPGPVRRLLRAVHAVLSPFDASARILVYGLLGFLAVLVVDTVVMAALEHVPPVEAFYTSVKVVVTVGPSGSTDRGPAVIQLQSAVTMLLALGFAAVLTAGLVNRLLDPRLTGIVGRSAVPRADHVIVVGLGQVGHRLCELLRELGVPVVVVERDPQAGQVAAARQSRLPVVIGDGSDPRLLARLSARRALALAAVTSDDTENIAVALTARGLRGELPIVLRAGDGDATSEIQSLFHVGVVRDLYRLAGSAVAAVARGHDARQVFPWRGRLHVVDGNGNVAPLDPEPARDLRAAGRPGSRTRA